MTRRAPNARKRTATATAATNPDGHATPPSPDRGAQASAQDPMPLSAAQLLTAGQLAERWQVPKSQVYRLTREGALPVVRLGRYFRYQLPAIEAWERNGGGQADA